MMVPVSGLKAWVDEQQEQSKSRVAESYFGRRRALSEEQGGSKAARQGINHKVQVGAFLGVLCDTDCCCLFRQRLLSCSGRHWCVWRRLSRVGHLVLPSRAH